MNLREAGFLTRANETRVYVDGFSLQVTMHAVIYSI